MEEKTKTKGYDSTSYNFKIAMVALLFFLTLIRLSFVFYFPNVEIVSDKVLLFVILAIVFYLWIKEIQDYYHLLKLNKKLEEAHEQLKQAEIDTIASLIKAVEAKDLYTHGHSERVTEISLEIANELGLSSESRQLLGRAAVLHDVGKIGIADSVLNKKEPLTKDEWEMIKSHSEEAMKILRPLRFLTQEREIILSHHEHFNGSGYPQALKGNQIMREAMILSIADSFDAMKSQRPYRQALTREQIISELKKSRGTQHDPQVVDALFSLLEKKPQLWEK